MRTREQIISDCEAAYQRLKEEAESKVITNPCYECDHSILGVWCDHPLVKGFGEQPFLGMEEELQPSNASLCGPEKALWEPRRSFLQRLFEWITRSSTPLAIDGMEKTG